MNAAQNHADFITAVATGLSRLIPADLCVAHALDRQHQRLIECMLPANPYTREEVDFYRQHPETNPLVGYYQHTGCTQSRRITDVIDLKTWLQSAHYQGCLARLHFKYLLVLPVAADDTTIVALSFNRVQRDFTKRECSLLDAFAPHFRLAWQRHKDPWRVTPPRRQPKPHDDQALTTRETDVLYWITQGKQNREIALILGISLFTVQKHVANILRKLDVENRHALTVLTLNQSAGH